ncbi:alpha/beta hydrolase [Ferrovibrio sp.]|uniref:alpha/beta fold hydrolase n=1 Tax=Ferrovibrio sp. TaxID=1917215 RepID=UPI0025BB7648|nr:alpha/beta hydrolase [Ferrovibrio sp.]MBX3455593.1 alpha/beta hydrolase [Ferrovibrio sp.]
MSRVVGQIMLIVLAILALALSGLGIATWLLSAQAEKDFPPMGRIIQADGFTLHAIDLPAKQPPASGQPGNPPLVFVHGAFGTAADFAVSIMPETSRQYRSIAIDRPGHGYSARRPKPDTDAGPMTPDRQARALRAGLQALGVHEKPILVGFSLGAAIALAWALDYPDEISGILLINPASHPWPLPIEPSYRMAGIPLLGPLAVHTIVTPIGNRQLVAGAANVFAPSPVPPHYAQAPIALTVRPGNFAANAEDIRTLKPFLAAQMQRYPGLKPPLSILVSDQDNATSPVIHSRPLAAQVPHAVLIESQGGGHPLHFSRQAEVLAAIDGLVARTRAQSQ